MITAKIPWDDNLRIDFVVHDEGFKGDPYWVILQSHGYDATRFLIRADHAEEALNIFSEHFHDRIKAQDLCGPCEKAVMRRYVRNRYPDRDEAEVFAAIETGGTPDRSAWVDWHYRYLDPDGERDMDSYPMVDDCECSLDDCGRRVDWDHISLYKAESVNFFAKGSLN